MTMRLLQTHRPFRSRSSEGFTLVELMVVILIIAVLIGAAVPTFIGLRNRAHDSVARQALRNTVTQGRAAAVVEDSAVMFPGSASTDLVTALSPLEPAYEYTVGLSEGPQHISVNRMSGRVAAYAALSRSGTCWYAFDALASEPGTDVAPGTSWAYDDSDDAAEHCGTSNLDFDDIPEGSTEQNPSPIDSDPGAGGPGDVPGGSDGDWASPLACAEDPNCYSASAWGDPHIVTYDGLGYEFMTIGDYVFTRSTDGLEGYPAVNIQIRNERTDGLHYDWVTSVSGVAAEVPSADGGSNIVTYLLGDGLHINGNPVTLEDETPLSLDDDPSNLHSSGYVVRKGSWIRVVWPGPEDLTISRPGLDIRPRTNHLNLHTYLTADYARLVEGVGGYPELVPNPYNDLLLTGGGILAVPTSNHRIHTDLAEAWAVEGSGSLFVRAGHTPLARDAEFPARFTQNDNPPSIVDDVDPEDFQQAQDFCVEAGVHPNNVPACIVDWLAAGGNPTHEEEAVQSALEATIPTLLIVDDEWDYMLDFEDGQAPPTSTWARDCCGFYTSFAEYAEEGGWVINENDTQRGGRLFYKTKTATVGTNFTLQTALQVTPHTDEGQPFKSTQFGVAIADGSQAWKVIVGPWWIQDGNAVGNPDKIWITNTTTRKPQIRISKQGSVATLYVDGHEAFQLTGASTNSNYVHFGDMGGGADGGKVNYEYIAWAHEAKGDENMTWWEPERWVYGLDFSTEDTTPQLGGWTYHRNGTYSSFQQYRENGAWVINEEHTQRGGTLHYSMSNAVGPVTTFQADVRIFPRNDQDSPFTSNSVRMQLADKNKLYQVILYPTSVYDPDSKKAYATDLVNRYAQIRIVRTPERTTLYVDGHEAFDLQGSTSSNNIIAWGIFSGNPDGAKAAFDNIVISPRDLGTEGMKTWVPNGWLHTLNFDDGRGPEDHGWTAAGSLAGTSFLEDGRYVIEDTNPNWSQYQLYRLSNAVTENFTFQADVRAGATESPVYPYTINNAGLQISDGQKMYKVRIHPTYVSDGNRSENLPDNKYVTDLHSRSAQIRIAKNAAGAALYVDGQHAMDLVGVDTTTNEIAFGLLTNLADRTGRVEFDNIQFAAQDLSWMGMNHWKPNPWAHLLTFDDGQDPIQHGWTKNGSVNVTIEDGALVIDDTNPNWSQYNAYRFASAAADEMTVQADIKVGPATSGHAFNLTNVGLRIADGTTIWGARVHADRVEDRNDTSKSVSVDFTSGFHTVAISKTAGGAALYVDGQYAFDLTGVAGSTNEVVFGLVDNLADRTGRAWFDNVAIRPDALD